MRKQAFSKYVKRLALLTEHQRVMLAQALAACSAREVAGQLGATAEQPAEPARTARQARTAYAHGDGAMVCRAIAVVPVAGPAIP